MLAPRLYDDLIMEHIKNARNYRAIDGAGRIANGSNPLCGDEMVVYLNIDGECIAEAAFQCTCCGISMASASIMTEMVSGRLVDEARVLVSEFLTMLDSRTPLASAMPNAERLAVLDTVTKFPARARCAALPWETLKGALDNPELPIVVG